MSDAESVVPRLARYAGVVLNAMTALAWGGFAVLQLYLKLPLYGVAYGVLAVMYTWTSWGFLQHDLRAYARSFQVHILGLAFGLAEVVLAHFWYFAPLTVLHGLAFLATWLARPEFFGVRDPRG